MTKQEATVAALLHSYVWARGPGRREIRVCRVERYCATTDTVTLTLLSCRDAVRTTTASMIYR